MKSQLANMTSPSISFDVAFVSLIKFSYWFKFHVNIITGSGVMVVFFFRNWPEIGNTTIWVLPNIWRLGRVRDTKFGTDVSSGCQSFSFYHFSVIMGKPIGRAGRSGGGGKVKLPPPSRKEKTQITVKLPPRVSCIMLKNAEHFFKILRCLVLPLKLSENLWLSENFRGDRKTTQELLKMVDQFSTLSMTVLTIMI